MNGDAGVRAARFQELIVPMLHDAYGLARFLARDVTVAEDILQEACLRAYRHMDTLRSDDARAWLLAIVRNCFYALRTEECLAMTESPGTAQQEDVYDPQDASVELPDHADPQAILERNHDRAVVHDLISRLPLHFREVLVLRELNDLTYREIARVTGAPIGTVMSRLARARALLRTAWLEQPGNGGTT